MPGSVVTDRSVVKQPHQRIGGLVDDLGGAVAGLRVGLAAMIVL
ncbi:hypothetical protein [Nocardia brasiliensis]